VVLFRVLWGPVLFCGLESFFPNIYWAFFGRVKTRARQLFWGWQWIPAAPSPRCLSAPYLPLYRPSVRNPRLVWACFLILRSFTPFLFGNQSFFAVWKPCARRGLHWTSLILGMSNKAWKSIRNADFSIFSRWNPRKRPKNRGTATLARRTPPSPRSMLGVDLKFEKCNTDRQHWNGGRGDTRSFLHLTDYRTYF